MNVRLALACVLTVGCTFGGSDEDPTNGYTAMTGSLDGGEPSTGDDDDDQEPMTRLDGAVVDAATPADAAPRDGGAGDAARPDASPMMCTPATPPAVCDPVKNTGCPFLTQCDLDPAATMTAGRCVFYSLGLGAECSANTLSTTCQGGNACLEGTCRKLCYCNADCDGAQKCTGQAPGPEGPVKVCQ